MKKLSYLFAVAASAACLCACTDVTDVLPAEQIPADARSTLDRKSTRLNSSH